MESAFYQKTVKFIAVYCGDAKAPGILERQLKHCSTTADQFSAGDLKKVITFIAGAAGLYIPDKAKKDEFGAKLQAMAA